MASTAICTLGKPGSDVEVADGLGVRLNELLARLHVRSHQRLERLVHGGDVLDPDLQTHARLGVHGRLPQLLSVHLAETLHAGRLSVLPELPQRFVAVTLRVAPDHLLALEDLEERWLCHVQVAPLDDLWEVAKEER